MSVLKTLAVACAALPLCSITKGVAATEPLHSLNIPAEPMSEALNALASQTGIQVVLNVEDTKPTTISAPSVIGRFTSREALDRLLPNSGLKYEFVNERTVFVEPLEKEKEKSQQRDGFRVAQADQGAPASSTSIEGPLQDSDRNPAKLEEVIVTAQKREERIQDVPISITALNEQALERLDARDINDIVRAVPNLVRQSYADGTSSIAIRGITSTIGSPTVGIYVDETPVQVYQLGFQSDANPQIFDLDRIEVLRGPQGTLYGASSMGGTLRYITNQPSLTQFSARAVTELGTTDGGDPSWQTAGAVGGPIKENEIGYRASVYYRDEGGYVDQIDRATGTVLHSNINSDRILALRGALTAKLGDSLNATLSTFYQQIERDGLPTYEDPPGAFKEGMQVPRSGHDHFFLPSLKIAADLGPVTLTSITSVFRRNFRQTDDYSSLVPEYYLPQFPGIEEPGGAPNYATSEQRNLSQEIRFASSAADARLQWVVGGFYQRSKLRQDVELVDHGLAALFQSTLGQSVDEVLGSPLLPGDLSYLAHSRVEEKQLAGFTQVNFKLTSKIEAVAGVRVSRDTTTTQTVADGPLNGGPTPPDQAAPQDQSETPVTPRLGLNLHLSPDNLLYGSVSKGFRSGGGNSPVPTACADELANLGLTRVPTTYASDETKNYEVGYKGTLLDRHLALSAAAFRIDWTGIQQNVALPTCGFSFVGNLGKARSQGFDLDLQSQPLAGLSLTGAVGYTDAQFVKTLSLGAGPPVVSDGDRVPYTPKWTGTVSAEQRFAVAANTLYLRVNYEYRSGWTTTVRAEDVATDPFLYRLGGYGYSSARAGVMRSWWDLSLFVDNLANARPILLRDNLLNPVTSIRFREETLRPRTVGVTFSARF